MFYKRLSKFTLLQLKVSKSQVLDSKGDSQKYEMQIIRYQLTLDIGLLNQDVYVCCSLAFSACECVQQFWPPTSFYYCSHFNQGYVRSLAYSQIRRCYLLYLESIVAQFEFLRKIICFFFLITIECWLLRQTWCCQAYSKFLQTESKIVHPEKFKKRKLSHKK